MAVEAAVDAAADMAARQRRRALSEPAGGAVDPNRAGAVAKMIGRPGCILAIAGTCVAVAGIHALGIGPSRLRNATT